MNKNSDSHYSRSIARSILKMKRTDQREYIETLNNENNNSFIEVLFLLLSSQSAEVKGDVLQKLATIDPALALIGARATGDDPSFIVRDSAMEILGSFGKREDIPRLLRALKDPNWVVRSTAIASLSRIGGKQQFNTICNAILKDPHAVVRRQAALALANQRNPESIAMLHQAVLQEKEEQAMIGIFASLILLGDYNVLHDLLLLLNSEDDAVRHATVNILMDISNADNQQHITYALRNMLQQEDNPGIIHDAQQILAGLANL